MVSAPTKHSADYDHHDYSDSILHRERRPPSRAPFELSVDEDEIMYGLSRLSYKLTRNTERLIESRFDIKITEWRILSLLGANGRMTMSNVIQTRMLLAEDVYICAAKLQSRGFVEFTDGDIYALAWLTASGRRVYDRVLPFMHKRQKELMKTITAQGRLNFLGLLQGFEEVVDAEFRTIGRSNLRFDELTDVIAGDDVF